VFTLIPYAYLGVAVLGIFTGSGFLICRYDPFVGFFRQGATLNMLLFGGGLLLLGVFVGRPYCRYLCPYGVLLRWTSTFSKWPATVTPAECTQCRLCETACPYSAIDLPVAPETAESRRKGVRRMIATLIAAPFLVAAMGAVGYLCHAPLARLNPTVQLAERIAAEEKGTFTERTIDSDAFRAGQNSPEELYATAHAIQVRFQYGAAALGVFLGLVICGRMLRLARAKENPDYVANRGACLSCARCFAYCPVETNNG
jgi:ferredoxin